MATTTRPQSTPPWWRIVGWGGAACLLLLPLLAMQFSDEVNWSRFDFVVFGAMLLSVGGLFELALRVSGNKAYRLAAGLALAASFLLVWANAAVGIIGSEDNPANRMFEGVLALGFLGALIVRWRAAGMVWVMLAMAAAQLLACVAALLAGWGQIFVFTGVYMAIWLSAAALFRKAARSEAR